jgi:hypothetical protein
MAITIIRDCHHNIAVQHIRLVFRYIILEVIVYQQVVVSKMASWGPVNSISEK